MFTHQRPGVEAVPDADVGQALKMAFRYYDGEPVDRSDMSALAWTVFLPMRQYIDEAVSDYNASVELGKRGASKRWNRDPIGGLCDTIGVSTEAEADTETEEETEAINIISSSSSIIGSPDIEGGDILRMPYDYTKQTEEDARKKKQAQLDLLAAAGIRI